LKRRCKLLSFLQYTNFNGDIVCYTSKTAKIKKGDITKQHIDIYIYWGINGAVDP